MRMAPEEQMWRGDSWLHKLHALQERAMAGCAPLPERRDAAEHRQHILAVARRLFAAHGVDAVSMHQIAQEAGVGQGTLYRRFAHKGALCMALLGENVVRAHGELCRYLDTCGLATSSQAQLAHVLSLHVAFNEENAPLLRAVAEAACGPRRAMHYHNPFYALMHGIIATLLERAVALGELSGLDTAFTADAILAALAIDLYLYQRTELGFTPERITQAVQRLYIDTLWQGAHSE